MTEFEILALTVAQAVQSSSISRSTIYELIGAGLLDARKAGGRTLIVAESLRGYIAALPSAAIRAPKQAA